MSERARIPPPDRRQKHTLRAPDRRRKPPKGLRPILAEIYADHPDLAEAILDVVNRPWNPREAGRWY